MAVACFPPGKVTFSHVKMFPEDANVYMYIYTHVQTLTHTHIQRNSYDNTVDKHTNDFSFFKLCM